MIDEEIQRRMRGLHVTYHKPSEKEKLSYWLAQSGESKLKGYCGKYTGEGGPCLNCGHDQKDHKPIEVADCVYFGTDSFGKKRQTWRVTSYYRRFVHPHFYKERPNDDDFMEQFTYDFIASTLLETKLYAREANPDIDFTYCFVWQPCRLEEAEAVGLTAVCGAIAPLECCEFDRVVEWSPEEIEKEKERAVYRIGKDYHVHSDFMWTDEPLL